MMHGTPPLLARAWAPPIGRGGFARNPDRHLTIVERQTAFTAPGASAPGQHEDEE